MSVTSTIARAAIHTFFALTFIVTPLDAAVRARRCIILFAVDERKKIFANL
jgi:hypothetical protein